MAIQHGIWKIGDKPQQLQPVQLSDEELLEHQIFGDVSILDDNWMLLGRQVRTDFGKYVDLLAVDAGGSIIIIELKKHRTTREVVAQAVDYAAWVDHLPPEKIARIYQDFAMQNELPIKNFDEAFERKFGAKLNKEILNSSHQMVVVAAELDASTERIINYLNDREVAINTVFFSIFEDNGNRYISRTWMIDPEETEEHAINSRQRKEWNGEFYASYGVACGSRTWEDARKYNFISAGGGHWYSKTLSMLSPGDRVWVYIPGTGYVGVAKVTGEAVIADEFITSDMVLSGSYKHAEDRGEDRDEYFVPVDWIKVLNEKDAVKEPGMFSNQNSVARPTTPEWPYTVERLKNLWGLE